MTGFLERFARHPSVRQPLSIYIMLVIGLLLSAIVIITPMDLASQAIFAAITILALFILNKRQTRPITVVLATLSVVISTRYIYWRLTDTLVFVSPIEAAFGIGLFLAEIYAWMVLVLGFIQTIWPLQRRPVPMPEDVALWPTVDVYVPTYNESLSVVRDAVLACTTIDYPADKLRVYLLDDGRREEFRQFASDAGVGYITRPDNNFAKAGNLNHALSLTDGDLIAIFDCDHIPTRTFLQLTVGWFIVDPRMALVQTPHHFLSPDPFERNLATGTSIPNEGKLFYGPVQDGNDLWDAAFFCGSCAVLRRTALEAIGGFAVETVTEDAHTALKLHKAGFSTAYLRIPMAAGLATERLALHVGQRMRWARGMVQIFRLDNPLFARGLSLGQRICYFNAMLHFLFALPRIVFLTAPLAYLLFRENIIAASGLMVVAYAGPHLVHATITNSRIQSQHRYSFWGEVYESVLAFYVLKPTLVTLFSPRRGKFNVTEKGGLLPRNYFDFKVVRPHLIIVLLLVLGLVVGLSRLFFIHPGEDEVEVLILNIAWTLFNMLTLGAAIAVARETRQVRSAPRLRTVLPGIIHLAGGRTLVTESQDLSMGGGLFQLARPAFAVGEEPVGIELPCGSGTAIYPADVISWQGDQLRVRFRPLSMIDRRNLVRSVLGRADAWLDWEDLPRDRPLRSAVDIVLCIVALFTPRRNRPVTTADRTPPATVAGVGRGTGARTASWIAAIGLGLSLLSSSAWSQVSPAFAPSSAQTAAPAGSGTAPPAANSATTRTEVLALKDLGATAPIRLKGVLDDGSLPFSIRRDEVVTAAQITMNYEYSPSLIPELSYVHIFVNDELVGSVQLTKDKAGGAVATFPINPVWFRTDNRVLFRFIGHYTMQCEDPLHTSLWGIISNNTTLTMRIDHLTLQNDLASLPMPFYDDKDMKGLNLPFIMPPAPSNGMMQAAGVVASWFGGLASYKGAVFPTSFDQIPGPGNAVVFATPTEKPAGVDVPAINGPMASIVTNPRSPNGKLLLVMGRNTEELLAAAQTMTRGSTAMSGASATFGVPQLETRKPYDAPHWLPTDRAVRFGELVTSATDLSGNGLTPGLLTLNFRTAPDLFVFRSAGVPVNVRYRYPNGAWLNPDLSRLDMSINNAYVKSMPLAVDTTLNRIREALSTDFTLNQDNVKVPPFLIFSQSQLQFWYDLRPNKQGECKDSLPEHVQTAIDLDSTIDLSGTQRYATMPNLAFFANSGFPFTRMADLSETAVVVPDKLTPSDVEAYLDLMGLMGDSTGYPVTKVSVIRQGAVNNAADKDLIILGAFSQQPLFGDFAQKSGRFDLVNGQLHVRQTTPIERIYTLLDQEVGQDRVLADQVLTSTGDDLTAMIGMQSPLRSGRAAVMIGASRAENLPQLVSVLRSPQLSPGIQGDLTILSGKKITSFRVGNEYTMGTLPFLVKLNLFFSDRPVLLLVVLLVAVFLVSVAVFWTLRRIASIRLGGRRSS